MISRALKKSVRSLLGSAGYEVRQMRNVTVPDSYAALSRLERQLASIPGMISQRRCMTHYLMAYSQSIRGDIVEVGSWQGRNTCYLAAACRDSGNGLVHAVDHFRGNPTTGHLYVVDKEDLSDLEDNFRANVERAGLNDWVRLHAADVDDVEIAGPLRMLFVDGEHSYDAVTRDLTKFAPLVVSGGLVLFDDYHPQFDGVVQAVQEWADRHADGTPVQLENGLAVRVK